MVDCDNAPVQTRWFAEPETNQHPRPGWLPRPTRPVQLRLVSWIRPDDGRQIWKATSDPIPGRTAVDKRFYFRAVNPAKGEVREVEEREQPDHNSGPDHRATEDRCLHVATKLIRHRPRRDRPQLQPNREHDVQDENGQQSTASDPEE